MRMQGLKNCYLRQESFLDKMKKEKKMKFSTEGIEKELNRVRYKERYGKTLRSTVYALITVAAIAVLVATLALPVLQIYGSSMTPSLEDGEIVVSIKTADFEKKDIVAFYYNNKILVKRVIATAGEWVELDKEGNLYVNGELIDEPYIKEKALGECDIEMPYQVPEGRVFVMGDHREVSIDSRSSVVGCVAEEQVVGKLVFRLWPLESFGELK